jgi:hypothetical protein
MPRKGLTWSDVAVALAASIASYRGFYTECKRTNLYGLNCHESARVLFPFNFGFLELLRSNGCIRDDAGRNGSLTARAILTCGYVTPTGVTHSNPYPTVGPRQHRVAASSLETAEEHQGGLARKPTTLRRADVTALYSKYGLRSAPVELWHLRGPSRGTRGSFLTTKLLQ